MISDTHLDQFWGQVTIINTQLGDTNSRPRDYWYEQGYDYYAGL
jgi:hypothetical protein